MHAMNIEELLDKSFTEELSFADFESFSRENGINIDEGFNALSLLIAKKYDSGEVSYEDGDYAMNGVWTIMLDYIMEKDIPLIEPCFEIYLAFDAGEWVRTDGEDPEVKYTKPAIKKVLRNA